MIIKGGPAGNCGWWSQHLQRDDTNERAEVKEIRGLTSDNLNDALIEMKFVAAGSRSEGNFMYQANINPRDHEHLTPEQWQEAVDTLEKNLGMEGHQRVVVEHVKEGREHRHVIWNRVDVDTMKVADVTRNYATHERTARELEQRFDHTPTPSPVAGQQRSGQELWEHRAACRSGIDPEEVRADLTQLWHTTDSGRAFAAGLDDRGFALAKGDRRDFCVIDHAGDVHSLGRRLEGVKATQVRERMADIDRDELPSVEVARQAQRERYAGQEPAQAWQERRGAGIEPEAALTVLEGLHEPASGQGEAAGSARPERSDGPAVLVLDTQAALSGDRMVEAAAGGFGVVDGLAGGVEKLTDFVADFLTGSSAPQPPPDPAERVLQQRRATAALENIRDSIERGRTLHAEDVRNLTPTTLENLRSKGDDYMRELIMQLEQERQRDRDRGRERDR